MDVRAWPPIDHDRVSLRRRNNADWVQPFQISDFDRATNARTPHDLTGAQMRMQIKAPPLSASEAVVLDASTENGMIMIASDAASGEFTLTVSAQHMRTIPAGVYAGDMLIFGADGSVKTAFTISLEVDEGATEPALA